MPEKLLLQEAVYRLEVKWEQIIDVLERMEAEKAVISAESEEGKNIYLPALYYAEMNCARILFDLNVPMRRGRRKRSEDLKKENIWNWTQDSARQSKKR